MDLAIIFNSILIIAIISPSVTCKTTCEADERKHNDLIHGLQNRRNRRPTYTSKVMELVNRGCFVTTNPYVNAYQLIEHGGIILAPRVQLFILTLLRPGVPNGGRVLVLDPGSGYLTACVSIMTGSSGVTVAALPNRDLTKLASKNVENWLNYGNRGHYLGLQLGKQIQFSSHDIQSDWSKETPFDAIFVYTKDKNVVNKMKKLLKHNGRMICLEKLAGGQQVLYRIYCLSTGFCQAGTGIVIEDVSFAEGQKPKEPVLPTSGKPSQEIIHKPSKETIDVPTKENTIPSEGTISVPEEETIGETPQRPIDVPPEATLDAYREEIVDENYAEELYTEYGVFDADYFPAESKQVKCIANSKVLLSLCISIILFITLF